MPRRRWQNMGCLTFFKKLIEESKIDNAKTWHILMVDIVEYSLLTEEKQKEEILRLTNVIKQIINAHRYKKKDRIFLPTGDGMAIGFTADFHARPLELATDIHLEYNTDKNKLKIGIHSGVAFEIRDINNMKNIAGSGINMAQRTISCCPPGHILVAETPAKDLINSEKWKANLQGPYFFTVKHDKELKAYNYFNEEKKIGNPKNNFLNFVESSDALQIENISTKKDKTYDLNDSELKKYINDLNEYYDTYQLQQGCNLSEKAIAKYPFQIDIIRLWVLFHNRIMEWGLVRETLNNIIKQENSEEIKAECYLGIFESFLNEFTKDRHKTDSFEQLKKAKEKYLDRVHGKETNGKYHYFVSRYFEEDWWILPISEKQSSSSLSHAVNLINKSISLYNTAPSGYQASHTLPWWLYCHKAILFKLWEHPKCEQNIKEYGEIILQKVKSSPLKKSVQMYAVTYYLLIDDYKALQSFLNKLDTIIKERLNEKSLPEIHPISEVDNFTFHHIELIFYKDEDKEKRSKYYSLLNSWFQKNTD